MNEIEAFSWYFVKKVWGTTKRIPIPDEGFEDNFRNYLNRSIDLNLISSVRDMGFGLSYTSLSQVQHEIDLICIKEQDFHVFELKKYQATEITKEIVFTFLGKVFDYYAKNFQYLSNYRIIMFLMTVNNNIDETIRKLCLSYGIKLIEPNMMSIGTLEYFLRDLYKKVNQEDINLISNIENTIDDVKKHREIYDYCFSDIFTIKDGDIVIGSTTIDINTNDALHNYKDLNNRFNNFKTLCKRKE